MAQLSLGPARDPSETTARVSLASRRPMRPILQGTAGCSRRSPFFNVRRAAIPPSPEGDGPLATVLMERAGSGLSRRGRRGHHRSGAGPDRPAPPARSDRRCPSGPTAPGPSRGVAAAKRRRTSRPAPGGRRRDSDCEMRTGDVRWARVRAASSAREAPARSEPIAPGPRRGAPVRPANADRPARAATWPARRRRSATGTASSACC
jgi:hypothetical protein